jgi:hypothetical protein
MTTKNAKAVLYALVSIVVMMADAAYALTHLSYVRAADAGYFLADGEFLLRWKHAHIAGQLHSGKTSHTGSISD